MNYVSDTIAALATAPGEGGIAIIRISGKQAIDVVEKVFSGPIRTFKSHTAHLGHVTDTSGKKIDQALALVMLEGRSYTGENTVELQCHGGHLASRQVLEAVLEAGARLAKPGEFTYQAFMNGKLDLAQAEAVQALIHAKNEKAYELARGQLEGSLSGKIFAMQAALTKTAAILEAWVDFPEEGLEFASLEEITHDLTSLSHSMKALAVTYHEGKKIQEGISLCIVGPPNAGKSSLMNALLRKERAIVTPIAGTTRDVLEDDLILGGLHFRLMDTAGIRETDETIEREGIRRSYLAMKAADLVLLVLDAAVGIDSLEKQVLDVVPKDKTILVWNKIDIAPSPSAKLSFPHVVEISASKVLGLDELKKAVDRVIFARGAPEKSEVVLTSLRHKEALLLALDNLTRVIHGLTSDVSPEFLSFDLRQALYALGTIVGANVTEDILSEIFSRFCIGK